ncbi:MAG: hypothetical protein OEW19_03235, partial [Acidobacteriota bacterium]|nr:hypothetical protein [Acidobacteriota bacterium]
FNAHLLTRIVHLQALHVEFFPLALMALDRVLTGSRSATVQRAASLGAASGPERSAPAPVEPVLDRSRSAAPVAPRAVLARVARRSSAATALASAFVLQALCSNYSLVFLSVALLVAAAVRAPEWIGPGRGTRAWALVGAGAMSVLVVAPFLWPYYQVSQAQGLVRSVDEVRLYSAGWLDYLTTAGRLHYAWWSHRFFEGRTSLFPGVMATGLAAVACLAPRAVRDARLRMVVAIGATGLALSFGPALPGYAWLHEHVPLLQGLRAAARWGFLFLTAVAVLAGHGVAVLERRWQRSVYWPAALMALLGLITIEALRAPMGFTIFAGVPPIYGRLANTPGALVELPLYAGRDVSENARYMVPATVHFRPLVNGYSGFETASFRERAARWRGFPSDEVIDDMRALGVTQVMLHVRDLGRDQVESAAGSPRLALESDDGERRLYRVIR